MPWNPQRQAYTPSVSRPMPGPGDLWGSPEEGAPRCHYAATCSAKGLTCLGNGCPWWEWEDFPPPYEPSEP
jgi:hypothetical protein